MTQDDWKCLRASAYDAEASISGHALRIIKEHLYEEGRFDDQEEEKKKALRPAKFA